LVNTVGSQFLDVCLTAGEAKTAAQAMAYLLQLGVAPTAVRALIRSSQIFIIGAYDETPRSTLGAHQSVGGLKIGHRADMRTSVMVNESFIGQPGGPAARATLPKRRQCMAARARLYPVIEKRGEDTDSFPLLQKLAGQPQGHFQAGSVEGRDQIFRTQNLMRQSAELAAHLNSFGSQPAGVANFQSSATNRSGWALDHHHHAYGVEVVPALQFKAHASLAEVHRRPNSPAFPVRRPVRPDWNTEQSVAEYMPGESPQVMSPLRRVLANAGNLIRVWSSHF
jgi:hypothetical protein